MLLEMLSFGVKRSENQDAMAKVQGSTEFHRYLVVLFSSKERWTSHEMIVVETCWFAW